MAEPFPGVPRMKKTPAEIAAENPSLWLGLAPIIGGAITTPMQLGEINRATVYQSAARHFAKLLAVRGVIERRPDTSILPSSVRFAEPARVVQALTVRAERQQRLFRVLRARSALVKRAPPVAKRAAAIAARLATPPLAHRLSFQRALKPAKRRLEK